ncbi:7531_t:CDS:2 [Rhizophagus irregularis]|nr:7531_t:CDS:2 [Rhizophagus irregularis]
MEWEKVAARAIGEVAFDKGIKAEQIKNWSDMGRRILKIGEEISFSGKKVKDEKNVNEKFLQNSPPAKKIWRVEGEKETVRMELSGCLVLFTIILLGQCEILWERRGLYTI